MKLTYLNNDKILPYKIEILENLKNKFPLNYKLIKEEIIITGPKIRKIDGVVFLFKEKEIKLFFKKKSLYLVLLIIQYEINDDCLEIEKIKINNVDLNKDKEIYKEIFDFVSEEDDEYEITLCLKSEDDIDYEMGCIFYKEYKKGDETHKNIILDKWNI